MVSFFRVKDDPERLGEHKKLATRIASRIGAKVWNPEGLSGLSVVRSQEFSDTKVGVGDQ